MRFSFFTLAVVLLCLSFSSLLSSGAPGEQAFDNSIRQIDSTRLSGPSGAHRPYIARRNLQSNETAASIEFEVVLKMRNFSDLRTRLGQRQRFSPQVMAATYHPLPSSARAVSGWLVRQGFTITRTDPQNLAIFAKGTVEQIQKAMGVDFARVDFENQQYTSAITAPNLPDALAPFILGINGLQPHIQVRKSAALTPIPAAATDSATGFDSYIGPTTSSLYSPFIPAYIPGEIAKAYNATPLYSSGITGTGQSIAIVIDTFPNTSDLTSFWSLCGIPQSLNNITFTQVVSGTLPSPSGEETLDVEWSSAMAPGSKVRVYAAQSLSSVALDACYAQVITDVTQHPEYGIHQMSMSYGAPENLFSTSQMDTDAQYFATLTNLGVTVFASSGDQGANPDPRFGYNQGISPETPSCDPNVTGVGGTALTMDVSGNVTSEVVWNDGNYYGDGNTWSTGGGVSTHFARPTWQTGTGVPAGSTRLVPDISAVAAGSTGGLIILNGGQYTSGGTSWSSPVWAGFCALMNQVRAGASLPAIGGLGPYIYPLIGTSNFRDITSGNNNANGLTGYSASAGYDLCTGIGVPNVAQLTQTLSSIVFAPTITSSATASGLLGSAFSYQISATNSPTSFGVSGNFIPNLSFNPTTGILSGTLTAVGTYTLTVSANNSGGTGSQIITLVVTNTGPDLFAVNGNGFTIGGFTTSGSVINPAYITGLNGGNTLAIGGNFLYVANFYTHTISKYTTSGTLVNASLITGLGATFGIAVSGSNLYVANVTTNTIDQYTTSGGLVKKGLITGLNAPVGLAVTSSNIYVVNAPSASFGYVGYYHISGTPLAPFLITGVAGAWGIAIEGSDLYLTNRNSQTVGRYTTSGSTVNSSLITGLGDPWALSISGGNLYVSNAGTGKIGKYTLSGTTINPSLLTGLSVPLGLGVPYAPTGTTSQVITFNALANRAFSPSALTLTGGSSSSLPLIYSIVSGPAYLVGNNLYTTGAGTVVVAADQPGNATYSAAATVTRTLTVTKGSQTIGAFPTIANQTYDSSPFSFTITLPTASSGLPVTVTVKSGPATISGNTVTVTGIGTVSLSANQVGDGNYNAAVATGTSFVVKTNQMITFPAITSATAGQTIALNASTTSGLPITFSVVSGSATISGSTVTFTAAGTVVLAADQAGNGTFNPASRVTQSIAVALASQTIASFTPISDRPYSSASFVVAIPTSSSGLPVILSVKSGPATVTLGNKVTLNGTGTVVLAANQAGNSAYVAADEVTTSFNVSIADQTISFSSFSSTYNATQTLAAVATSGLPITYNIVSGPATLAGSSITFTGVGTVVISADQPGNANVNPAPQVTATVTVTPLPQVISPFQKIGPQLYGTSSITIVPPTTTEGLPTVVTVKSGPATLLGNVITFTGTPGTIVLAANAPADANRLAALEVTTSFSLLKADQTLTFDAIADVTYGATVTLNASASSGLPVDFAVVSGPASISGNSVSFSDTGTVSISASQAGDDTYNASGLITRTFKVTKASQTIAPFAAIPDQPLGTAPFTIVPPTATSGLPVNLSVKSGPATISGNTITLTGTTGTVMLTAYQAGNIGYSPAPLVNTTFNVVKATQTITFPPVGPVNYLQTTTLAATSSSGLPVSYSIVSGSALLSGNTLQFNGSTQVVLAANQSGNTTYAAAPQVTQTINAVPLDQTVTINPPQGAIFVSTAWTVTATATSNLPVSLRVISGPATFSGNILSFSDSGDVVIGASQAGKDGWNPAPEVTLTITVSKRDQQIFFDPPSANYNINETVTLHAVATSGLPVTFTVTDGSGIVTGNDVKLTGIGTLKITATQDGNAGFNAASPINQFIYVRALSQTITPFATIPTKTYGAPLFSFTPPTADSGLPVSIYVKSGPAILYDGYQIGVTGAGVVTLAARQDGGTYYPAAPEVTTSFTVAKASQTVIFPAVAGRPFNSAPVPLSASASTGLPITYSILSGPGTVSGNFLTFTGVGYVTVQATQAGNANYNSAGEHIRISGNKGTQTITFPAIPAQKFGNAPITLGATASSSLPVSYSVTGPASVAGNILTLTGAGSVSIKASQAGDATYGPAAIVTANLTVTKASQTVTFPAVPATPYNTPGVPLAATVSSGLPITYSILSGPGAVTGNMLTFTGIGMVTVQAGQSGNANYLSAGEHIRISSTKASQSIAFAAIPAQTFGNPPVTLAATATSGLPVSYTVSGPGALSGNALTLTGAGTITITANQAGNASFGTAASVKVTVVVAKANQVVTFPPVAGRAFASPPVELTASASSGLPMTYNVLSGPGTVDSNFLTLTGAGVITVQAIQLGNANINGASARIRITAR